MGNANWTWGLSLIALTVAMHATGVVMMAIAGFAIRARLEPRKLGLRHVIPILIGLVGAVGLLLAAVHPLRPSSAEPAAGYPHEMPSGMCGMCMLDLDTPDFVSFSESVHMADIPIYVHVCTKSSQTSHFRRTTGWTWHRATSIAMSSGT